MDTMQQRMEAFTSPTVRIVWYRKGNKPCFRPDTVADGTILNSIFGKRHFAEEEYNRALEAISDHGFFLESIDPEEIFGSKKD